MNKKSSTQRVPIHRAGRCAAIVCGLVLFPAAAGAAVTVATSLSGGAYDAPDSFFDVDVGVTQNANPNGIVGWSFRVYFDKDSVSLISATDLTGDPLLTVTLNPAPFADGSQGYGTDVYQILTADSASYPAAIPSVATLFRLRFKTTSTPVYPFSVLLRDHGSEPLLSGELENLAPAVYDLAATIDLAPQAPLPTPRCACAVGGVPGDADNDGVPDAAEFNPDQGSPSSGTNRFLWDSDGDGLSDGYEDANGNGALDAGELNPRKRDTDGDGVWDGTEVLLLASDPRSPGSFSDADADGLPASLDPNDANPDTDGDGFADGMEAVSCGLAAVQNAGAKPPLGDANCDAFVSNLDALIVQTIQLGAVPHGLLAGESNSDVNRDGFASNLDSLMIHSRFLLMVPFLPIPAF